MRTGIRRRAGCLALIAGLGACGPSQEDYDRERAKVRELQQRLAEAERDVRSLRERLQSMEEANASLNQRLEALGANLQEAEGRHRSAQERLAEMERALEELRARERQHQARLQTFCGLLQRLKSMIEGGRLRVRVVRNRMVVELPEGILFASGRARLKDEGKAALAEVARVLAEIPNRDFQVAGHTDNVPIRTRRFPSNWELSTQRAVNVVHFLVEQGFDPRRLSAAGYADTQPVASNDEPQGRQQNRRIEIVLLPNYDELPDLSKLESLRCGG